MEKIYKGEIQRLFPIFEAIKEGKTIQWLDMGLWRDIDGDDEGFFLDTLIGKTDGYRIKPEPKYRPFANAEESWAEMLKHQPFGWVKDKVSDEYLNVYCVSNNSEGKELLKRMFKRCVFIDKNPFGVKDEED